MYNPLPTHSACGGGISNVFVVREKTEAGAVEWGALWPWCSYLHGSPGQVVRLECDLLLVLSSGK